MNRVLNFSAGPSGLDISVLKKAQAEFLDYHGLGFNIMEVSHRGKIYEEVHNEAISKIRKLYNIDDDYAVLFLQGGGHLQFAQVPMNLYNGGVAEYVNTGVWTTKAIKEAKILGINHEVIASGESNGFKAIPEINFSKDADYCYICSNNTIYGTQYKDYPDTKGAPLVIDASSDLLSREIDFKANNIGLLWGGAQKNAGPAGVTLVIVRKDLLDRVGGNVPTILRYKTQADANSLANTPPTFGIYMLNLVLDWIIQSGGLSGIRAKNQQKADLIYGFLDSCDFYNTHAKKDDRSLMNVVFKTPSEDLDKEFVAKAETNNMIGLKGHRLLGGLRASTYNAVSLENVKILVDFMSDFAKKNG